MADNVDFQTAALATPANATRVATDQLAGGEHVQFFKLMDGTLDGTAKAAVSANGLAVDLKAAVALDVSDRAGRLIGTMKLYDGVDTALISAAGELSTDMSDRAGRLLGIIANLPAALGAGGGLKVEGVAGGVAQPVSGTFWQGTQPVSLAAAVDVSDRVGRALGVVASITAAVDVADRAARLVGVMYGSQGQQIKQTATNFNLVAELAVGGTLIDPRVLQAGTAQIGLVKISDGVDTALITTAGSIQGDLFSVAGTGITLGQKAAAASIPVVLPNDANGATQATALFTQNRALSTYTATFRLAARPYALSNAFGAAGRKQYATIHHAATAVKTVKLKRVEIALESSSAAAIVMAELVRITTAPVTGNPAITPAPTNPANAAAEATCLALPTTAATEGALHSMTEYNLGITAAGSVINPPPGLNWYTLWPQTQGASEAAEDQFPTIRAGVLEGFAVTLDASALSTVKGYVVVEFTEE